MGIAIVAAYVPRQDGTSTCLSESGCEVLEGCQ
jgi:hypothetical protein